MKILESLQNDDEVGKLKNQKLSTMPSNAKAKIDFGSTTYMMFIGQFSRLLKTWPYVMLMLTL
jgi:hypothetical protein